MELALFDVDEKSKSPVLRTTYKVCILNLVEFVQNCVFAQVETQPQETTVVKAVNDAVRCLLNVIVV